jgi:coatomer protein complex subunit alpha (xenin)
MGGFHSALLLGDVSARIAILRGSGQPHLAYAAAVAHGLTEAAEEIAVQLARDIEAHHTAQQQAREEVAAGEAAPRPALPAPLPAPDMRSPQSHLLSVAEVTAAIAAGQAYGAALTPAGARTAASRGVFTPPTVVVEAAAHLQVPQPALPLVRPAAPTAPALLIPPPRVWPLAGPWPRLAVRRGFDFTREGTESDDRERAEQEEQERLDAERAARAEEELDMGWDSGSSAAATSSSAAAGAGASAAASPAAAGGGDWDLNIDLGDELNDVDDAPAAVPAAAAPAGGAYGFVMPEAGRPAVAGWTAAALPGALIAAGAFEQAMHVLNQHYGICNFAPFKPMFVQGALLSSAQAPLLPWLPSQPAPLTSSFDARYSPQGYPPVVVSAPVARFTPACAAELQREMLASMTAGNFPAVAQLAQTVILQTPMMLLGSEQEQTAALEGLATAREYALALKLDAARNAAADAGRKAELAAYATHCAVAPVHAVLMLWIACKYMLAVKNYRTIALLCRRILDLAGASDMSSLQGKVDFEMVRKMLKKCETQGADTTQLRYDPSVLFAVCATTLVPIPGTKAAEGRDVVVCGLCGAKHAMAHQGQICTVCNVSKLGAPASGPRLFVASKA